MFAQRFVAAGLATVISMFVLAQSGCQSPAPRPAPAKPMVCPTPVASQPATKPAAVPAKPPVAAATYTPGTWLTSYDQAVKAAGDSNKLVLADFTGSDWCIWCKRLKAEVFDTPEFKDWAAKNVVLLELDYPRNNTQDADTVLKNAELARKYKIEGYPTILFLKPSGQQVAQSGYMQGGPNAWTKKADELIKAGQ